MPSFPKPPMIPAPNASTAALHEYANDRFGAAKQLLEFLSRTTFSCAETRDINRIADALLLLMSDGCAAMDAIGWRMPVDEEATAGSL